MNFYSQRKLSVINAVLLVVFAVFLGLNQAVIAEINEKLGIAGPDSLVKFASFQKSQTANSEGISLSGDIMDDTVKLVASAGAPAVYGEELGVSFSQVQQSINIMKQYDPAYGGQKIILEGDDLKRYTDIGLRIACEYCCGAKSIVFADGSAACGCAHSIAMRGLMAYLIKNHGDEYSDDEILRELARWKGMYFPKQMIQKLSAQLAGQQEFTPDTAALVLGLDLPDYGKGGEVPLPSEIKDLPGMVGGC